MSDRTKRTTHPWKHTGSDRGYQRRIAAAVERRQYTAPGMKPNAMDPEKVRGKRAARKEWA